MDMFWAQDYSVPFLYLNQMLSYDLILDKKHLLHFELQWV